MFFKKKRLRKLKIKEAGLVAKINAVSEIIERKSSISPSQQTNMAKWNESLGRIQAEIQIITKELK